MRKRHIFATLVSACLMVAPAIGQEADAGTVAESTADSDAGSRGMLVLSNTEVLGRGALSRPSSRPKKFEVVRVRKHPINRERKFLQMLFMFAGLAGIFFGVLALRSVPPSRSSK